MRVVSLLPSATEIVYALGAGDVLCGVSGDCDHPAEARRKPVVSSTALPAEAASDPAAIDREVRSRLAESPSIYSLNSALIRELRPELILAQDLCRVCAVPSGDVSEALDVIGCRAEVLSLDPHTIDDVIRGIERVGDALGFSEPGRALADQLRSRVAAVRHGAASGPRRRVLSLEWPDPPFVGGHWVPEMVAVAGGHDVLGEAGKPSRQASWDDIAAAAPEVIVYMPCGFGVTDAAGQVADLYDLPAFAATPAAREGRVFAVDASSYFSRPGPRLVDGIEILAGLLHPDRFPTPSAERARRVDVSARDNP